MRDGHANQPPSVKRASMKEYARGHHGAEGAVISEDDESHQAKD